MQFTLMAMGEAGALNGNLGHFANLNLSKLTNRVMQLKRMVRQAKQEIETPGTSTSTGTILGGPNEREKELEESRRKRKHQERKDKRKKKRQRKAEKKKEKKKRRLQEKEQRQKRKQDKKKKSLLQQEKENQEEIENDKWEAELRLMRQELEQEKAKNRQSMEQSSSPRRQSLAGMQRLSTTTSTLSSQPVASLASQVRKQHQHMILDSNFKCLGACQAR